MTFHKQKSKEMKTSFLHLDVFSDVLFQPFKMIGEAMFYPAMTQNHEGQFVIPSQVYPLVEPTSSNWPASLSDVKPHSFLKH